MYDTHPNACKGILVGPVTHSRTQFNTHCNTDFNTDCKGTLLDHVIQFTHQLHDRTSSNESYHFD